MMIGPSFHKFTFATETNIMYNAVPAANGVVVVTHQPPTSGSYLKVGISGGTSNTGTITITGTLLGAAKTNTMTYTGTRSYITTNQYDTVSSVVSSGLGDEATKPTIKIESCDISGTPKTWTSSNVYYGTFKQPRSRTIGAALESLSIGRTAPTLYDCTIDTDANTGIKLGDLFAVQDQNGTFEVWSEPIRHFQLGTDLVDTIKFYATLKSK